MTETHLDPHRAWILIRDGGTFTTVETNHLEHCRSCHDWIVTFVNQARKVGFSIKFEIPDFECGDQAVAA